MEGDKIMMEAMMEIELSTIINAYKVVKFIAVAIVISSILTIMSIFFEG